MNVSIIIPTLNRPNELNRLLQSFLCQDILPKEILIIDQGIECLQNINETFPNLPIKLFSVSFHSLTKARNFGVDNSSGEIIGFLDDDIVLEKDYMKNVIRFFETHPNAKGVQGVITNFKESHRMKVGGNKIIHFLYECFAKVFLLNRTGRTNRLLISGRNQYAVDVTSIQPCEWLSGIGNYRKDVFETQTFDERLQGYGLGEDKLFSYEFQEKNIGTLFVDPDIRCQHLHTFVEQHITQNQIHMKVNYTYFVWRKFMKKYGWVAIVSFVLASIGDLIIIFGSILIGQNSLKCLFWYIRYSTRLLFSISDELLLDISL